MSEESTPIFDALWEKYNATPIYDQLLKKAEQEKHEELVKPYRSSTPRVISYEEYLAIGAKKNYERALQDFCNPIIDLEEFWEDTPENRAVMALFKEARLTKPYKSITINVREEGEKLMNRNWQDMVNEFRVAMDLPVADGPRTLTTHEQNLHIELIRKEFENELVPAILANDLVEIYDAGIDVIYYVIGLLSNAGMQIDPGFIVVHESNMSKMDPVTKKAILAGPNDPSGEPEGKVLKGPDYFVPNLAMVLNEQSYNGHEDISVYKNLQVPLTLGIGGPKIGEGVLNMDHNGNLVFEGEMQDVSILPVIDHLGFSVSGVSIGDDEGAPDTPYWDDIQLAASWTGAPESSDSKFMTDDQRDQLLRESEAPKNLVAGGGLFPDPPKIQNVDTMRNQFPNPSIETAAPYDR